MAFRSEELAVRLAAFRNDVPDYGYRVEIVCPEISALEPLACGRTYPLVVVEGEGLDEQANLIMLKAILKELHDLVESQIAPPPTPPAP